MGDTSFDAEKAAFNELGADDKNARAVDRGEEIAGKLLAAWSDHQKGGAEAEGIGFAQKLLAAYTQKHMQQAGGSAASVRMPLDISSGVGAAIIIADMDLSQYMRNVSPDFRRVISTLAGSVTDSGSHTVNVAMFARELTGLPPHEVAFYVSVYETLCALIERAKVAGDVKKALAPVSTGAAAQAE